MMSMAGPSVKSGSLCPSNSARSASALAPPNRLSDSDSDFRFPIPIPIPISDPAAEAEKFLKILPMSRAKRLEA